MTDPFSYSGKRVVVTGAATGVGAALLDLLAEIGAPEVTVLDIKEPSGPHTRFIEANLSDPAAVDAAVAELDGPIDVLFNNAGVAATQAPRVVLAINYLALRRLSEQLLERIPSGGAIVNTASIAGGQWPEHLAEINELLDIGDWDKSLEWVDANLAAVGGDSYSFSKEVVRVWGMRHSHATIAKGVRTNSVCPAPIDTPLLEDFKATMGEKIIDWTVGQTTGAYMTPREVAAPLAFLGSSAASYVNGHDLVADGGFNAAMTTGQVDFSGLGVAMSVATRPLFDLDDWYRRDLEGLYVAWQGVPVADPRLAVLNEDLAAELGADLDALRSPAGVAVLAGNATPEGAAPLAEAYSGHQFGSFSPVLGDGRALLLGEVVDRHGRRRDLHLKGSGRTPFSRGGDGRAALGPMLREHLIGEAMHALGIPTTRALAVVATGEDVARDTMLPGAVLTRVAASHLRVGTFQYAASQPDPALLERLAAHAIARHHPAAADAENPALAPFEAVVEAQASLIARWMLVGFVHGVMNTDNMTISGESIDFGPCAFIDAYDPATVFSSIDHGGRYAFGNQPQIGQWNLARLAEAMLPLLAEGTDEAIELAMPVLQSYTERFDRHWLDGMRAKLGLTGADDGDRALVDDLLTSMRDQGVDFTSGFRSLADAVRDDTGPAPFGAWAERWQVRRRSGATTAEQMDRVNLIHIPRNHLVEEALAAATTGDLDPYRQLLEVVSRPFDERPGLERYVEPAPADFGRYRTFCGT